MPNQTDNILDKPINRLKGIGKTREELLKGLGIFTVEDILYYFPRNYEDRRTLKNIRELCDGETCSVVAEIRSAVSENRFRRNLSIQKVRIGDDSGAGYAAWFNRSYLKRFFRIGQKYIFFGKVNRKNNLIELENPTYEKADEESADNSLGIYPVYPLTAGISQNIIRKYVKEAFERASGELSEFLPSWI
ncbi:MAG: DNA helicase RecG, partial [Eubacteriales bacterium]|nr:DNA helicase RecG [Eubacteriales bacterium]